ncbi:hypothetical protein CR513_13129, partial [Mucuna pruriens]
MYLKDKQVINNRPQNIRNYCSNNNNRECQLKAFTISGGLDKATIPAEYERHYSRPQTTNRIVSQYSEAFINASAITLRSGKALPQPALQQLSRSIDAHFELDEKTVPLPIPTRAILARKPEFDEELLRMFRKVEINILLLNAIKHIPKYAIFLKELCVHKRKKMRGGVEPGGIVSTLTRNEDFTTGAQQALPKKCRDPKIFPIPCTIGICTLADAMLDLGASINFMPTSIYKPLNFGDLEPTGMTIQLANRSVVLSLGVLENVLVQGNELIFPTDFYVLDIEDETLGKGSTLILGQSFLMTSRTKIDVHFGTLLMEFGDTLV